MSTAPATSDPIPALLAAISRDGVVVLDTTGEILEANAAFRALCTAAGGPSGTGDGDEAEQGLTLRPGCTLTAGRHVVPFLDGSIRAVEVTHHPLGDGRTLAHVQDVTAEEESAQLLSLAFDGAATGMALIDPAGCYRRVNPALERILGRPASDLIGRTYREFTHPEDIDLSEALAEQLRSGLVPVLRFDKRYLRPDGSTIWVDLAVSLVRNPAGGIRHAFVQATDITARRAQDRAHQEMQAELQWSQRRNRDILQAARVALWELDEATGQLSVTETHREMFGLDADAALPTDMRQIGAMVHPADLAPLQARRAALARTSGPGPFPFAVEYRIITPDGAVRWIRTRGELIRRHPGDPGLTRAVTRQITGEVEMREALRESEERFRSAFESSAVGMAILSPTGTPIRVNPALVAMLDRDADEVGRLGWTDVVHPDDRAPMQAGIDRLVHGEARALRAERRIVRRDGTVLAARITASAIQDVERQVTGLLVQVEDLSDQHREAAQRLATEARLTQVIEALEDGVWEHDLTTGTGHVSPSYFTMLGYPARTEATYADFAALVHPDDLPRIEEANRRQLDDPDAEPYDLDARMRRADGTWALIRARGRVVERDATGRALRAVGTHTDVSDRRLLEDQFRQAQKMEAIGKLAGGLAHDFNNLLTAITATTGILLEDLPVDDARRADLEQIAKAANRGTTLTRQLLAFSRQEVERLQVIALDDAVAQATPLLHRLLSPGQSLTISGGTLGAMVRIDPAQLELALLNLVANARDAMPGGGVVTIRTRRGSGADAGHLLLEVADTGHGIEEGVRARLFEPFFTTKPQGQGTGLGLPTVYGFVQRMGGTIRVDSTLGKGSCFTLALPVTAARESDTAPAPPPLHDGPHRVHRVLVVDDDAVVRQTTVRLLRRQGYGVLEADGAAAALDVLGRESATVDVVLSDYAMPGQTGEELLQEVVARHPDLRGVLMSGFAEDSHVRRAIAGRQIAFLGKPFTLDELVRAVEG